jgi:hypothetical protein
MIQIGSGLAVEPDEAECPGLPLSLHLGLHELPEAEMEDRVLSVTLFIRPIAVIIVLFIPFIGGVETRHGGLEGSVQMFRGLGISSQKGLEHWDGVRDCSGPGGVKHGRKAFKLRVIREASEGFGNDQRQDGSSLTLQ